MGNEDGSCGSKELWCSLLRALLPFIGVEGQEGRRSGRRIGGRRRWVLNALVS
jgi:hypothetical protein